MYWNTRNSVVVNLEAGNKDLSDTKGVCGSWKSEANVFSFASSYDEDQTSFAASVLLQQWQTDGTVVYFKNYIECRIYSFNCLIGKLHRNK